MSQVDKLRASQLNKIRRLINTSGEIYSFTRYGTNKFGEPDPDRVEQIELRGVLHTMKSYVKTTTSEAAEIKAEKSPLILSLMSECTLKEGDQIIIDKTKYKVNDITDINNYGILADISLGVESEVKEDE